MKFTFGKKKGKTVEEKLVALENRIFKKREETSRSAWDMFSLWPMWDFKPATLEERLDGFKKDFEELDHKFDLLERYLQVEYFKTDEQTATYDWADKTKNEGFRKATKSYEELKKEKDEEARKTATDYED